MDKWRDRKYRLLLYPDDQTHVECMRRLEVGGYKFAAILHDSDVWADGDEDGAGHEPGTKKKEHWHVVLKFAQPKWSSALEKELGIKSNYIRKCDNFDGALCYLVHEGYPGKYQYDAGLVFGPLAPALGKLLVEDDEGSRVLQIVDIIDKSPGIIRYREILVRACNNGLYGDFRRLGSGIKWLIDEHNADIWQIKHKSEDLQRDRERQANWMANRQPIPFATEIDILDRNKLLDRDYPSI